MGRNGESGYYRCSDRKRDGEDEREESERTEMKRIKMLNRWTSI